MAWYWSNNYWNDYYWNDYYWGVLTGGIVYTASGAVQFSGIANAAIYTINQTWGVENKLKWSLWQDSTGATAQYDTEYGVLRVLQGDIFYSNVVQMHSDFGILSVSHDDYDMGEGAGLIDIRGDTTAFSWDATAPTWQAYNSPFRDDWTFVQLRVKIS